MSFSISSAKELLKKVSDRYSQPVITPLVFSGHDRGKLGISGFSTPLEIPKRWGGEKIYHNNKLYCAKLLTIEPNSCTSMHFHLEKHETMINVDKGILYIDYIVDKEVQTAEVKQWESFIIAPGLPHKLRAEEEIVRLIEASTISHDDDSIRLPEVF